MSAAPSEDVGLEFDESAQPELEVAQWMMKQFNREQKRLAAAGQAILPVTIKNSGIIREGDISAGEGGEGATSPADAAGAGAAPKLTIVNRVELNSAFDFSRVVQVMTSPPIPCPCKPGFSMVFLVMIVAPLSAGPGAGKKKRAPPPPLLAPYIYDSRIAENDLSVWSLVNNDGEAAVIKVENAALVTE